MPEPVACARHPRTQTRLRCAICETPICPACAVTTPVGMKCPVDARQPRSARALGSPRQLGRALAAAVFGAAAGALGLAVVITVTGGVFVLLLSFGAGILLGDAVKRAAEGNGGPRFRTIAVVAACAMVGALWVAGSGPPRGLGLLMLPAAGYGASTRFPWA